MVQDAYVAALKELPRLREPERFYPWLCRIAVNRAIEDRRKVSRRARIDEEQRPIDVAPAEAETSLLRAESAAAVKAALERLPEGQRAAVTMRFFDELRCASLPKPSAATRSLHARKSFAVFESSEFS